MFSEYFCKLRIGIAEFKRIVLFRVMVQKRNGMPILISVSKAASRSP